MNRILPLLVSALLLTGHTPAYSASASTRSPIASDRYAEREIAGWKVHINRELLERRVEVGTRALSLLETKLTELKGFLPKVALEKLRTVPIWLGVNDYEKPNAVYHPSAKWLREHGFNPDKAQAVEIPNAAIFIEWSTTQPMIVLHELAHAYHHQVLGHSHSELRTAFESARGNGRYDQVRHARGKVERAYALNNVQEFFAEMSEAYFGRNDFFPFTRGELQEHDPEICALIGRLWGELE